MSKQWRIYVIIWLTGVWGEQGAALAVDDLLNKRQFLRHRCRNHTEPRHQGIKRCNSSHHSEVGVKVWKQEEKWAYFTECSVENYNTYNKTGWLQVTRSCLFTYSSVPVTRMQHTRKRLHSHSWINYLVNNIHILRSLQGWVIVCVTPLAWIMTSMTLCTVGCTRIEIYLDLHCSTALASTATSAFVHTCVPVWSFLKWKWCWPHSTCRGFGVGNFATGCVVFMLLNMYTNEPCSQTQIFQHDKKNK